MPTLVLQPASPAGIDTHIRQFSPTANFGTTTNFSAGIDVSTSAKRRILIKFDISSLPPNAIVSSAILSLYCLTEVVSNDFDIAAHRSLVDWYAGLKNASAPDAGQDGSTWNLRNANGAVAWVGGAGGASGSDWAASATDTTSITNTGQFFDWDVTADVQDWADDLVVNYGWWLIGVESGGTTTLKTFVSSEDSSRPDFYPKLTITYSTADLVGTSSGVAAATAIITATGYIEGLSAGTSTASAIGESNQNLHASSDGISDASATVFAAGYMEALSTGTSVGLANLNSKGYLRGTSAGLSVHVADMKGIFQLVALSANTSTVSATPSFAGRLRGLIEGLSSAIAVGYARARSVAAVIGCNPTPLLYITDGSIKNSGQLNLLNFLSEGSGFKLQSWRPQIAQYKEGGRFSNGPLAQGRRLRYRNFDNAIETFELSASSRDQDDLILFQQELLAWQEAAANYWVADFSLNPVYLVAKAARETNARYAVIHMISIPELENPYQQPFYSRDYATFTAITPRIERGHWLSTPPGQFECVQISSQRSWTVSGWETGS
jgi:hypothetical protein